MQRITTIGFDIAKSVFQVHGVDATGEVVIRRQLKRRQVVGFFQKLPACLVGIEACASSHHWSRELQALGHNVRLMPPAYVKPYVKRQRNDAAVCQSNCRLGLGKFYLLTFCWRAWDNCSHALWIDVECQESKRHVARVPPLMYKAKRFINQGAGSFHLRLAIDGVSACSGDNVVESRS